MTRTDRPALIAHVDAALRRPPVAGLHLLLVRLRKLAAIEARHGAGAVEALRAMLLRRLCEIAGPEGFVADAGGDVVALVKAVEGSAERFAHVAIAAIAGPVAVPSGTVHASANAGVCAIDPSNGDGATHLERALRALEHSMAYGPDSVEVVSDACGAHAAAEWDLRVLLEEAMPRDELLLEYQPIRALASGRVNRAEALLRWDSASMGRIGPHRFVPILEESGLIVPVGEWVLERACRQAAGWRASGLEASISVNVSRLQLQRPFEAVARRVLERTGCDPRWIALEVTETALVQEGEAVRLCLDRLVSMGFTIAIDDFGSGYSSLGQLAQLPVHHLKLDRSLIDGLPSSGRQARIVKAVVALAQGLELGLTAEGVELPAQAEWLAQFPAMHAQGYLYGRPMAAADLAAMISAPSRAV